MTPTLTFPADHVPVPLWRRGGRDQSGRRTARHVAATGSPKGTPMSRKSRVSDLWRTQMAFFTLAAEAQTVIALRTLGMAGLWNVSADENTRMVTEKTEAFSQSAKAAALAITRGASADQIAMAAMKPLQRKTRPNATRLAKAGPKTP